MNTVQHKTKTVTRHEIRMEGPITARDIQDFIVQVDRIFEELNGRKVAYDDDYFVAGDETGMTVTFEIEEKKA